MLNFLDLTLLNFCLLRTNSVIYVLGYLPQAPTRLVSEGEKVPSILRMAFWMDENLHEIIGLPSVSCQHAFFVRGTKTQRLHCHLDHDLCFS